MTDTLNTEAVGVAEGIAAETAGAFVLDLSRIIKDDMPTQCVTAGTELLPVATALADYAGQLIRSGEPLGKSLGYAWRLSVPITTTVIGKNKNNTEMSLTAEFLGERVPLGSDNYRWALVPNGTDQDVILKIVKRRGATN